MERAAIALGLVLAVASSASALHTESNPVTRLTRGADHRHPGGRHWSTRALAFSSTEDLLGNGSTGRQIFLFDLLAFDCNRFSTQPATPCPRPRRAPLVQVTHGPGSPDNPSLVFTETTQYIAFDADGSFNGGSGPSAEHRQIFLSDLTTGEIVRVTDSAEGDSGWPSINAGGTIVTFQSTAPLAGRTDLTGIPQVFAYRRQFKLRIGTLMQITAGRGASENAIPNRGGDQLVFQSSADLLGDGRDTGVSQIFLAHVDFTAGQSAVTQVTAGNAPSIRPYIAAKNDLVIFESKATSFGAASVGPGNQIYMAATNEGPLPGITQITTQVPYGDCAHPVFNDFADGIAFVCTGDPLENGTTGNRAFVLTLGGALGPDVLHQITGRGDVRGPVSLHLGRNFLTLADNSDLAGTGFCGYQLFIIDFFKDQKTGLEFWHAATQRQDVPDDLRPPRPPQGPPDTNVVGNHTFALNAGAQPHGSALTMMTHAGPVGADMTGPGQVRLEIGATNFDGEANVTVVTDNLATVIPPAEIPGVGTICLSATGQPGAGVLDCNGGRPDGDLLVQQFHGPDPANPGCVGGCFEARTGTVCRGPHVGVCRGPVTTARSGVFAPGELQISFPVTIAISVFDGFDGLPCTADDDYTLVGVPMDLQLTTGAMDATIVHADAGDDVLTASAAGTAFDCDRLVRGDLQGARLVGMFPLLDVPDVSKTLSDMILTYALESTVDDVHGACNPSICSMASDCDDHDATNGAEDCVNRTCIPGVPPCDDGNPCNGVETNDAVNGGCIPGTPPDCSDGNPCTTDTCSRSRGCVHASACDDANPCNGTETCDPQSGTCSPGAAPSCDDGSPCTDDSCNALLGCDHVPTTRCDDGDLCNGVETCDAATGTCGAGTPADCDDQNPCTIDACDAALGCTHTSKCDDGDACNGVETCEPASGTCQDSTAPVQVVPFVACELNRLSFVFDHAIDPLAAASPASVGGKFRQRTLIGKLQSAQKKMRAPIATVRRAKLTLAGLHNRLQSFVKNVQSGMARQRINSTLGAGAIATVNGIEAELTQVGAKLP